jgi:hypothetical protein
MRARTHTHTHMLVKRSAAGMLTEELSHVMTSEEVSHVMTGWVTEGPHRLSTCEHGVKSKNQN